MRTLLTLLFILLGNLVIAQGIIVVKNSSEIINISNKVSILDDKYSKLTLKEILENKIDTKFIKNYNKGLKLDGRNASTWVRMKVQNLSEEKLYLQIEGMGIITCEVYTYNDSSDTYQVKKVDSHAKINEREIPIHTFLCFLPASQKVPDSFIYLRLSYIGRYNINLKLGTIQKMMVYDHYRTMLFSLFFGVIFIMVLYHFSIYFIINDSSYLYYAFYLFSIGAYTFVVQRYFLEIINTPSIFIIHKIYPFIYCFLLITSILFFNVLLEVKKYYPFIYKTSNVAILLSVIVFIISIFDTYFYWVVRDAFATFLIIYLWSVSVYLLYHKKNKTVLFYLIANTFLLIGVFISMLQVNHIIPDYPFFNAYMIGSVLEIIFFSLALSNKIKVLTIQKEKAQIRNIKLIQQQKETLEIEVNKRTIEIETQNEELTQQKEELLIINEHLENSQAKIKEQNAELAQKQVKMISQNEKLHQQKKEIELLKNNLENIVSQRTYELKQTLDNLTKQNQDLEQFSYIISHNLRAPVARILGLMNIINSGDLDENFKQEVLNHLKNTTVDLDTVIKDLSQIISIRNDLNKTKEEIDIIKKIEQEKFLLKDEIERSKVIINTELVSIKRFLSIKSYFQSILHNLLSNAIKYKSNKRNPIVIIKTEIVNDFMCLSVQDNGIGIDLSNVDTYKIFGLYQRMHDHVEGKGLGLFLVKTQIESLGGKVEIESELDVGTIFKVYFPM